MTSKFLYVRCNGGHYFRGDLWCPFDGWTCEGIDQLLAKYQALPEQAKTIDGLRAAGVDETLLARVTVIEFGNPAAAFEAVAPDMYLHNGRQLKWSEIGLELS